MLWFLESTVARLFAGTVLALAVGTLVGLVVLWPGDRGEARLGEGLAASTERAQVERIETFPCSGFQTDECRRVQVRLLSGPDEGATSTLELGAGGLNPELSIGDQVRLTKDAGPAPQAGDAPSYSLSDFERRSPMLWLLIAFALLVVLFGRLRGALSLLGLALSLLIVLLFIVPAILAGSSPLAVALIGSFAVMLVTIPLAHGVGPKSLAAILGTAASLVLTVLLALLFTNVAHLTGLSSEEATLLQVDEVGVSLQGLVLAGMVIGALGVLDDMTISQASAVMALRAANPAQRFGEIYSRGLEVGRDHVTATVNTLVLAYVGAALPILLIFSSGEIGFFDAANVEVVAKEIVATLVGSIGLIAAAPLTTALAATLSARVPDDQLERAGDGHSH